MSESRTRSATTYLSWRIWTVYAVLLFVAVPWYWPRDDERTWLGFPLWVVIAVGVSILSSAFTAWLLLRPWPGEGDAEGSDE